MAWQYSIRHMPGKDPESDQFSSLRNTSVLYGRFGQSNRLLLSFGPCSG